MNNLKNKTIVITGASQGLGAELSLQVAKLGAKVALVARSEDKLNKLAAEIKKQKGEARVFVCDITDKNQIISTVKEIGKEFGKLDILINNAGIWTDEELEQKNSDLRLKALETNVLGHIDFTYEVLPIMKAKNEGHIVNVISTSGVSNIPAGNNTMWKTYGATKWAMKGFSKALRNDLADTKIKVTRFYPGGFDSNLYENAGRSDSHNQPWMMQTKDVAEAVVFTLTRPVDVYIEELVMSKMMD